MFFSNCFPKWFHAHEASLGHVLTQVIWSFQLFWPFPSHFRHRTSLFLTFFWTSFWIGRLTPKPQIVGGSTSPRHESVWKEEGPPRSIELFNAFIVKWCSESEGYCRRRAKPTFPQSSLVLDSCAVHFPRRNARWFVRKGIPKHCFDKDNFPGLLW